MNKSEFIEVIGHKTGLSKVQSTQAINAVMEIVNETLQKGEDVVLVGFGTFTVKERAARTGRNPKTGEPLEIAASKVPSFKAGKALKDAVNTKPAKKSKK